MKRTPINEVVGSNTITEELDEEIELPAGVRHDIPLSQLTNEEFRIVNQAYWDKKMSAHRGYSPFSRTY